MSFSIRNPLPFGGNKGLVGNVIIIAGNVPNFENSILGSTGVIGPTGATGSSSGGGGGVVRGTGSFNISSMMVSNISNTTGSIIFTTPFSTIPFITATSNYGTLNVTNKQTTGFDYTLTTPNFNNFIPIFGSISVINYSLTGKIINGNPSIIFAKSTSINFTRSNNSSGTVWGTGTNAATGSFPTPSNINLQVVNGNPAISYYDNNVTDLKYSRSGDINGDTWPSTVTVASTGNVGAINSMRIVNGNPAISYQDSTNNDLRYIRATDVNGDTWGTGVVVASTGSVGAQNYLQVVNGNPAIVYQDQTNLDIRYVRATDVNGDTWGNSVTVHDGIFLPSICNTLQIINGNPAFCYTYIIPFTQFTGVYFMRALDVDGTTWNTPIVIDVADSLNSIVSTPIGSDIFFINGFPAILYQMSLVSNTIGSIYLKIANDVNGTSWGDRILITTSDITTGNGMVAYTNGNNLIGIASKINTLGASFISSVTKNIRIDYIASS
jgi:hypothetical protein